MLDFMTQMDYLRDVQRTFGSGGGRVDMFSVLIKMFVVAAPLICVMAMWHYRHLIGFTLARMMTALISPKAGRQIEKYLVTEGVLLDVHIYDGDSVGRKLGNARVTEVSDGEMKLQLINFRPTGLKLKRARIICYTKPFTYSGKKINAFVTFVGTLKKRGSVVKEMSLLTPSSYTYVIRRRHSRQRVSREGAVRVKAWDGRKRKTFWMIKPDLQTINNPARYGTKTRLAVENISPGGMRLLIMNPKAEMPPLQKGSTLILRVSVWNPQAKKYSYFNVIGTIRSRFKAKGNSIGLGLQFSAEGEKVGSQYLWKTLSGELKSLAEFLEKVAH